jgi:eukaryotic-like serine/threonine-protein kinase
VRVPSHPQQAHLQPGYRLDDRYELLYPFAEGGMATVWVARVQGKHGFEKLVAVKTILPHLAGDRGFRTMFLDEAAIASRIRHPNVADIDDLGEESGTLYMVLEWITGDSWSRLYQAMAKKGHAFPLDALLRIAADACAGLHAAHELRGEDGALLNVVHRDVSPQNILVATSGITKVIDFGIAKALDRAAEETRTGTLKGKLLYAAPEQVKGRSLDRRADIWAMGTILYHYLSGQLPYEGKNDLATLKNVTSGRRPAPLPDSVPAHVASVVMTALSPLPEGRYPTALDMQRAIEAAISRPTTPTDVASLVTTYLADRIESRRQDLAEALAEAAERAGPRPSRARLGSYPELLPPAHILEAIAGRSASSSVPEAPPPPPGARASASTAPHVDRPTTTDSASTRGREGLFAGMRPVHWCVMVAGAAAPLGVWSLVLILALQPPRPRGAPAPARSAPAASSSSSATPQPR